MTALYLQVLSIGIIWTSFHCSGMCGPLIAGVTMAPGDRKLSRGPLVWARTRRVLGYQSGRAVTYALLGGLAGLLGASIESEIDAVTRVAGLAMAVIIIGIGIARLPPVASRLKLPETSSGGAFIGRIVRTLSRFGSPGSFPRMFLTGLAMGLLPCMLMFWVLAVSATSASLVHGAALMVVLVVMTTPVLVGAACASGLTLRSKIGPWVVATGMLVSGFWLGLIGLAANGWVEHVHLPFRLFGELYTIMLW